LSAKIHNKLLTRNLSNFLSDFGLRLPHQDKGNGFWWFIKVNPWKRRTADRENAEGFWEGDGMYLNLSRFSKRYV